MVNSKLTSADKKVLHWLLDGKCVNKVASITGYPESSVRASARKLCRLNLIQRVSGSYPVVYSDPLSLRNDLRTLQETPPKGGESKETLINATCVTKRRYLASHGIDFLRGKNRLHLKGFFKMEVRNVGDFLPVQDNSNAIVVAWGDKYFPRGQTVTRASLYAFGGILNFEYVSGNKGVRTIHFWPEDILVDQSQIDEGKDCLRDRALYLRQILHDHGWRLHDPDQRGSWHLVPFVPDKLYEIYAKVTESSDAEVTLDTSPGEDEIEVFTPEANDLLNHLPSRFFAAEAKIEENTERIDNARDEIEQRLMQEVQQLRIETLQGDKFALQRIRQLQEFREREESEIDQVMIHPRKARAMEGYQ